VRLLGQEQIEHALAAGKGALVWVAPFVFAPLAFKVALSDHGDGGIEDAARAFVSRLESFVLAAPGQFHWGCGMTRG
jgi:anti-sigma regulatory factor (Ser/Thr protein kinase)